MKRLSNIEFERIISRETAEAMILNSLDTSFSDENEFEEFAMFMADVTEAEIEAYGTTDGFYHIVRTDDHHAIRVYLSADIGEELIVAFETEMLRRQQVTSELARPGVG